MSLFKKIQNTTPLVPHTVRPAPVLKQKEPPPGSDFPELCKLVAS